MTVRVALHHHTGYRYDRPVQLSPHAVRLRPAPHTRIPIESYALRVTPPPCLVHWQQDPFGNYLARLVFPDKRSTLDIEVDLTAALTPVNPFDFFLENYAERFPFAYPEDLRHDLISYLEIRERGPRLSQWLAELDRSPQPTTAFLGDFNHRLRRDVAYLIRDEAGVQTCEETLARATGSCRDSGWLEVQLLRHLGLAARFVSGYLVQLAPQVPPAGTDSDFAGLHAWTEVYLPGAGWVGLDPTSGLYAGEGHIPLACTPTPAGAAPITGSTEPCRVEFSHRITVTRLGGEDAPSGSAT